MITSRMTAAADDSSWRMLAIQLRAEAREGSKKDSRRSVSCQLKKATFVLGAYSQGRPLTSPASICPADKQSSIVEEELV